LIGSATYDYLSLCHDGLSDASVVDHYSNRTHTVYYDMQRVRVEKDLEVGAVNCRAQVRGRGAASQAVPLGHLIDTHPFLDGAIKVGIVWIT
jgi:hypothetical protein